MSKLRYNISLYDFEVMLIDEILLPNQALVYSEKVDRLIRDMQVKQLLTEDVLVSSDKDRVEQFIEELQSHRHS